MELHFYGTINHIMSDCCHIQKFLTTIHGSSLPTKTVQLKSCGILSFFPETLKVYFRLGAEKNRLDLEIDMYEAYEKSNQIYIQF